MASFCVSKKTPTAPYPRTNPLLPGAAGISAVYTLGDRNPQGIAFRPVTGVPFITEHAHRQVTRVRSEHDAIYVLTPGANFGWPDFAGPETDFAHPAWTSGPETLASSGSTFLAGDAWGSWQGWGADIKSGKTPAKGR
jgi:aldose sugar dehydrogenase